MEKEYPSVGFRTTETHGRSFYGYIRPPWSPIDRSNLSKCAFFFFRIGRVTPRRETVGRYETSVNGHRPIMYARSRRARRLGQAFRNISVPPIAQDLRACVAARLSSSSRAPPSCTSRFFSLLFSTVVFFFAVSPFIEAVYPIRATYTSGLPSSVRLL